MTTLLTNVEVGEIVVTVPGNVTFGSAENVTVAGCPTFTFTASASASPTLTAMLDMSVRVMNPLELEALPDDEDDELDDCEPPPAFAADPPPAAPPAPPPALAVLDPPEDPDDVDVPDVVAEPPPLTF